MTPGPKGVQVAVLQQRRYDAMVTQHEIGRLTTQTAEEGRVKFTVNKQKRGHNSLVAACVCESIMLTVKPMGTGPGLMEGTSRKPCARRGGCGPALPSCLVAGHHAGSTRPPR